MAPRVIAAAAAVGLALLVPWFADSYTVYLLTQAFLFAVVAISLDLVWGYAGILDMGHSIWFGTGALVVGMMTTKVSAGGLVTAVHGGPFTYAGAILAGVAIAATVAAAVGWYSFTSRGSAQFYIAIVSLALATAAQTLYTQLPKITGGENGLSGFALPGVRPVSWYFVAAGVLSLAVAGGLRVVHSDFGLLMRAIRDQEQRVRYLGYDVRLVKILIFALGAALAAFAGGLYAATVGLVSAPLFGFLVSTDILVWVAVGGRGTVVGPVIGAIVLGLVGPRLNQYFPFQWQLFVGALFVAVVVLAPDGLFAPLGWMLARLTRTAARPLSRKLIAAESASPGRDAAGGDVIELRNVRFAYGSLQVLRGVNLAVQRGELLCIVGPNGAGKSTLLNLLTDGRLAHTGSVMLRLANPSPHRGQPPHRLVRSGLGRKFQTPALFPSLTVAETILLAGRAGEIPSLWRRTSAIPVPQEVLDICAAAGLDTRTDRLSRELSHGLKQGLELATATAVRPEVLLLDEPTAGLTSNERELVGKILTYLTRQLGVTVILIEHDLDFVLRIADRVAVLNDGRMIECGPPDVVARSAVVREAYLGVES